MLGSDKGRYFAAFLVGLIATGIAFATLVYSFQLGNLSGYNEAQSYGYAGKYPESTTKSIDICFSNPELSHRQECIEQAIASGRESQRGEYDLNAQRDMAEWAFWLLVLTGLGLVVTIVGTIGLYWQIMLTREAVEDTGKATDAMLKANRIAENNAERQMRAYIGLKDVLPKVKTDRIILKIVLQNTGQTPASVASFKTKSWIGSLADFTNLLSSAGWTNQVNVRQFMPGETQRFFVSIEGKDFTAFDTSTEQNGIFAGKLVYTDAFSKTRTTSFCFYLPGANYRHSEAVHTHFVGNSFD